MPANLITLALKVPVPEIKLFIQTDWAFDYAVILFRSMSDGYKKPIKMMTSKKYFALFAKRAPLKNDNVVANGKPIEIKLKDIIVSPSLSLSLFH